MSDGAAEPTIGLLEAVWTSMAQLGAGLSDEQFDLATDCPGWSVKDQFSHIIGIERMLAGLPTEPPVERDGLTGIAAFNEGQLAVRRGRAPAEILAELADITTARLAALRTLPPEKWEEVGPTPVGDGPYRTFMEIRVFDSWVHEQDVRRATATPGHMTGPVAAHCFDWHGRTLGFIVAKKAGAPDGTSVTFDISGDPGSPRAVAVVDGRAGPSAPSDNPTVTLTADAETFNALCCGRWDADRALAEGRVSVAGDAELGARIVAALAYVI